MIHKRTHEKETDSIISNYILIPISVFPSENLPHKKKIHILRYVALVVQMDHFFKFKAHFSVSLSMFFFQSIRKMSITGNNAEFTEVAIYIIRIHMLNYLAFTFMLAALPNVFGKHLTAYPRSYSEVRAVFVI
jgi:hypothetical protein